LSTIVSTRAAEGELPLPRVQPRVLRQEVLAALRAAILSNEIPPGSRLLEADVATRMGVSRAPVREAMRQLEQEGLVESFAHRGAVVIGLPEDEIDAIYELRALIEAKAIARACESATPDDLARLDAMVDEMRGALKRRDIDELAEIDLRFHGTIVALSSFSLLRHIWSSLDGLVRVRSYQALDRPGAAARYFIEHSIASHERLAEVIRKRDPVAAAAAAREHILEVPERLRTEKAARAGGRNPRDSRRKTTTRGST
jgi:DNA-binding GntR family transcriptional regulator